MNEKLIDMHTHTCYSDGELEPNELIDLAIKKNINTLAITDHDTINGIKEINRNRQNVMDSKIEVINGIELSAKVSKGRMHILGYDFDINNPDLNKKLDELKENSLHSVLSVMEQIKRDYGIRFSYQDIKDLVNAKCNLGRPYLANLCVKYGYAKDVDEAFDNYLTKAYNKVRGTNKGIKYPECIDLIIKSGGIPVLAHPKSLGLSEKDFLIILRDMIKCGLQGMEVYHYTFTEEEMNYYLNIAKKYNLLISGGSDYHGIHVKPDVELGTGKNNNLKIKELSIIDEIHRRNK